jgi:hypothetical protein
MIVKINNKFGLITIFFGFFSLVLSFIAIHADSLYGFGADWFVLSWLDDAGLINNTASAVEISNASVFSITEVNVINWTYYLSVILACSSLFLIYLAAFKREHNLYFSVGLTLASSSLLRINFKWGLIFVIIGIIGIMYIRKSKPDIH